MQAGRRACRQAGGRAGRRDNLGVHAHARYPTLPRPPPLPLRTYGRRKTLSPSDIFDAISEEEVIREAQRVQRAAAARASADATAAGLSASLNAEYGAKVCALLAELHAQPQGSKAVVFSSWGRLLRLVGGALQTGEKGPGWCMVSACSCACACVRICVCVKVLLYA